MPLRAAPRGAQSRPRAVAFFSLEMSMDQLMSACSAARAGWTRPPCAAVLSADQDWTKL